MKTFAEIDIQFELTEYIILIHNSILQEIYEILRLLILLFSLSSEFVVFIRATEKYKPREMKSRNFRTKSKIFTYKNNFSSRMTRNCQFRGNFSELSAINLGRCFPQSLPNLSVCVFISLFRNHSETALNSPAKWMLILFLVLSAIASGIFIRDKILPPFHNRMERTNPLEINPHTKLMNLVMDGGKARGKDADKNSF